MARRQRPFIPVEADDLTAEWFTEILGGGEGGGSTVTAVEVDEIGEGVGFVGQVHRCRLEWSESNDDLPRSVIIKLPTTNETNRGLGETLALFEREITVYRDLGTDLELPMPEMLYSAFDPHPAPGIERVIVSVLDRLPLRWINWVLAKLLVLGAKSPRRYVLVIEDIADARPPTQADGGSVADAVESLRTLARSHAHTWNDTSLPERSPLIWPLDRGMRIVQAGYIKNKQPFIDTFPDFVDDAMVARLDRVQDELVELAAGLTEAPTVMLHGDYRLDNILFRSSGELVVLDYQSVAYGRPAWDVAYFITTALTADNHAAETELLSAYHGELVAAGVTDFSMEQLTHDVRVSIDVLAHRLVLAEELLDTDRGDQESLGHIMTKRVLGWIQS